MAKSKDSKQKRRHRHHASSKKEADGGDTGVNPDAEVQPAAIAPETAAAAQDSKVSSNACAESKLQQSSFDSVRQYVVSVLAQAQFAVDDLRKRVIENEHVARASERTMVFLDSAKAQVEQAVKAVRETPISDLHSRAVADSLAAANIAIQTFGAEATKFPANVSAGIARARSEALNRLNAAAVAVNTWRAAAVSYGVRKLSEFDKEHLLSARACDWANVAVERTKSIDQKFQVTENAKKLYTSALEIDHKWELSQSAIGVAKRAQSIGDSLTGACVSPVVSYVSELAVSSYNSSVASLLAAKAVVKQQAAMQRNTKTE